MDKGEVTIEYCPTEDMLADFFTKPLQGALFRKFRAVIMGWEHINTLRRSKSVTFEERVENHEKDTNATDVERRGVRKATYAEVVSGRRVDHRAMGKVPIVSMESQGE